MTDQIVSRPQTSESPRLRAEVTVRRQGRFPWFGFRVEIRITAAPSTEPEEIA